MNKYFFLFLFLLFSSALAFAQQGYQIKLQIDGFEEKELYLGYHLMDKQYLRDTVKVSAAGEAVFQGEDALPGGVYLVVMPPQNQYFPILISQGDQHFSIKTTSDDPYKNMQITGSEDNQIYYEYLAYLGTKVPIKNKLFEERTAAEGDEAKRAQIDQQLRDLDEEVRTYHRSLVEKNPNALSALIAQTRIDVKEPAFTGSEEEIQMKRYLFYKQHWFDHYQLDDPRMLRSPDLLTRVDGYLEKLTPQHPDSINVALDYILGLMENNEETFKHYLVHYLNKYSQSKIVGMDAVYVHLVENYYAKGRAPWVSEDNLKKMVDNAMTLKPILVGKIAPDIKMIKRDQGTISLHDVEARYTLLIFWEPDCGHCKKTMPSLKEFYAKYQSQGVEVFAVCTKKYDVEQENKLAEVEKCWQFMDEHGMNDWLNVVDPFIRSRYYQKYDVKSTPRIFILDEKKEILVKGIGKEQLDEVMGQIIKSDQAKMREGMPKK